jgi:hypothetical protein
MRLLKTPDPKRKDVMRSTLCDDVQIAFERACSEQDFEVAEHLLCALEAIARREKNDELLDRAYWALFRCPGRHKASR